MKKLLLLLSTLLSFCVLSHAAGDSWMTDFEKAKTQAAAQNKYMLLDFTGSDWCGWCVRLNKEVFSQDAFKAYAKQNLVCVELDFPRNKKISNSLKKQNKTLAEKYQIRGYPTIILLSPKGEQVATTGYRPGGAEPYVEHLKELIEKHQGSQEK